MERIENTADEQTALVEELEDVEVERGLAWRHGATPAGCFDRDKFLLKQKHLSLTEKYGVFDEHDRQVLFVRREAHHLKNLIAFFAGLFAGAIAAAIFIVPAAMIGGDVWGPVLGIFGAVVGLAALVVVYVGLRPKRHIGFFTDHTMQQEVLKVFQDKKWVFINATYTAADPDFNLIGWFRKNHLYNIFRKRWYVYGPDGAMVCVAMEDSIVRSISRRLLGQYGAFIRTNFILLRPDFRTKLGEFNRKFTLLDKYVLDVTADCDGCLDRRLAVALGVLLDTAEKR